MNRALPEATKAFGGKALRSGDGALLSILAADFFGALAGATVHLTMVWWVLSQGVPGPVLSLLVLCIFLPLNVGVLLTGVAVDRFGSRRLLIASKLIATCGAITCWALLVTNSMTLPILALVAIITYGAMAPSVAADISRVPALTRLAGRRLAGFHATNGVAMVLGQIGGLGLAGFMGERYGSHSAVAIGVLFVVISVSITWAGFPRDRSHAPSPLSAISQLKSLSRSVIQHLDRPGFNFSTVLVTAAIIATAQGCIEVALPMAVHAEQLPATALSGALVLAVVTGVAASVIAQSIYERVRLSLALLVIAASLFVALIGASAWPNIWGLYAAIGATSAAAAAAGTLTITALQDRMPVSLQAQAIGLWEFLILSSGSVTILITGFTGKWSLLFITSIGAIATLMAFIDRRSGQLDDTVHLEQSDNQSAGTSG